MKIIKTNIVGFWNFRSNPDYFLNQIHKWKIAIIMCIVVHESLMLILRFLIFGPLISSINIFKPFKPAITWLHTFMFGVQKKEFKYTFSIWLSSQISFLIRNFDFFLNPFNFLKIKICFSQVGCLSKTVLYCI